MGTPVSLQFLNTWQTRFTSLILWSLYYIIILYYIIYSHKFEPNLTRMTWYEHSFHNKCNFVFTATFGLQDNFKVFM